MAEAVRPLQDLRQGEHRAVRYLDTLLESLQPLGLTAGLTADAAGIQLLELLQQMEQAVKGEEQTLSWL